MKHQDAVTHVAFSPDGRKLVSTSVDTTARVWDSKTGQALVGPLRHRGTVWEACFSPDGQRVLTGEPATPPILSDQGLQGACFNRDGRRVLIHTLNSAQIFDATTSRPITPPMRHSGRVFAAAFSPDERWLATASDDNTARVWDAQSGFPITEPLRHAQAVTTLVWLPGVGIAPTWLPDLAEALDGKRSEAGGGSVAATVDRLDDLRRQTATPGNDPDQRWLHWFLVHRLESPDSSPALEDSP